MNVLTHACCNQRQHFWLKYFIEFIVPTERLTQTLNVYTARVWVLFPFFSLLCIASYFMTCTSHPFISYRVRATRETRTTVIYLW